MTNGVANDFNVQLVEVLSREAVAEVGGCERRKDQQWAGVRGKSVQLTQRCLDEDCRVELLDVSSDAEGGHGVEGAERMAALEQVVRVALVQGTGDEEDDLCE